MTPTLLSPAGSLDALSAAICAGALTIIALIFARLSAPSYEYDEFFPPIQETKTE